MLKNILKSKVNMKRFTFILLLVNSVILYSAIHISMVFFEKELSFYQHASLFILTLSILGVLAIVTWFLLKDVMDRLWYMRDILNQSMDGIARISPKGEITYVNPSFCRYFNIKAEAISGLHWQKIFAEQSIGLACHKQQIAMETGEISFEAMAKTLDQKIFPIQATIIRNKEHNNKGFYLYIKDLTEQKAAQKEALQKHRELRQLFDNLPIIVFYKDNANNIVRANKLASDLLDRDILDVEGKSANDLFPEKSIEYFKDDMEVLRSRRSKYGIIEEFHHIDGQKSWVKTDKIPFKDPIHNEDRILTISQDITMMKLAEVTKEQLINDLKNTNKELERFAYICSHDLQEPMRLAASYSEKLSQKYNAIFEDDPQGKKYVTYIHQNMERAHEMVRHLLDYAHIGEAFGETELVDIKTILTIIKDIMKYKFHKQKVKFSVSEMPKINANREQMLQLFRNIIDNSIKFQKADQKVQIQISVSEEEHYYKFELSDNGIGIAPEHLENVFDIFKRLHKREDYDGSGVGLTMAKRIVTHHGGEISAVSDGQNGTKIIFTLAKELELLKSNERHHGYKQLC